MNAGQKLVALSGLSYGTALTHLLAITQGSGPGKTVFASQMAVCIEAPQITLIRKPSVKSSADVRPATQSQSHDAKKKRIDVVTQPARIDVLMRPESMFVVQRRQSERFVRTLPNTVRVRRDRTVKVI